MSARKPRDWGVVEFPALRDMRGWVVEIESFLTRWRRERRAALYQV